MLRTLSGLSTVLLLASCDERPQVVTVVASPMPVAAQAPAPPEPKAEPKIVEGPRAARADPAPSCTVAYQRATAALAKRDFEALAQSLQGSVLMALAHDVVVPANFAVMGHALATSGPKGSPDALAAILNRYGAMLTVEERVAGLDTDQMEAVTAARALRDGAGFIGAMLEWADDSGYPGDPLAAINGAQGANPVVAVAIDPKKGLIGTLSEKGALPDVPKPKTDRAPASANSLQPLFSLLLERAKVASVKNGTDLSVSVAGKLRGTLRCARDGSGWGLGLPLEKHD